MLGDRIREHRKKLGLSQCKLAEAVNLDVTSICKIETNKAKPSIDSLGRIAAALNVTPGVLLEDQSQAS